MKRIGILWLFLISVLSAYAANNSKPVQEGFDLSCSTLELCLREIDKHKYEKYFGVSKEETVLAKRIAEFGEPALVELIRLLESDNPVRSQFAAYAITEFESIDPQYFEPIKNAIEKNMSWIDRALGAIHTDQAAEYSVDEYLKSESSIAVIKQGERALPFILARTECGENCDPRKINSLIRLVSDMAPAVKKSLAQKIIARVRDQGVSKENKRNLLSLLFAIGVDAKFVEEDLQKIKTQMPDLGLAINGAFIGIKSKYSGRVFADLIQAAPSPDIFMLRNVAEMGSAAIDAGPALEVLLSNPEREIRLGAARTIGYLGYDKATPKIIHLLDDKNDFPLNWVAIEALGMIGDPSAIPALEAIYQSHWHPIARLSAQNAIERIKKGGGNIPPENYELAYDYFAFHSFDYKSCEKISLKKAQENPAVKLDRHSKEKDLKKLAYTTVIYSYGPDDEAEQREKDSDGVIVVDRYNMVEHQEVVEQIPDVALKVEDGWLVGGDRGEWGGELVHINQQGKVTKLFDHNVQNIIRLGNSYIAVTGMAHMGISNGQIIKLEQRNGQWYSTPWIYLPGAPEQSWLAETGDLYLETYNGGSMLISPSGDIKMARCLEN